MGQPFQLGRYTLHAELAAGGMAAVYLARQTGAVGFGKTVAIKRLHPHLARDQYFVTMFLDEARLAARITHPNVVPILDVVSTDDELFLVLEYVRGETLAGLLRALRKQKAKMPVAVAAAIITGLLAGLHAAHEAHDELGKALDIVHRDVSPQNLIVGADGTARVLDFGVAKAATRLQTTREGQLKGKIPYMAPEQLSGEVTPRTDVYAATLVLWETLTCQRLFRGETEAQVLHLVMTMDAPKPSSLNAEVPAALDAVVAKGLARDPANRYATAREMAAAIEACVPIASPMKVAEWIEALIGPTLAARDAIRAEIESGASSVVPASFSSSTPALPAFPQVAGGASSSSMSNPGVAESTASLVIGGAAQAPPRSRWPIVAATIGVVGALAAAVAIGVVFGRHGSTPSAAEPTALHGRSEAATGLEPSTHVAAIVQPAPSSSVTSAAASSIAAQQPSAAEPKPTLPHAHGNVHPKPRASTNENDSLLDSR
jgi:serine/threonine protein kinase